MCDHCLRTADQPISHLVFWNPPGGHPKRGRRKMSYTDTITRDTNLNPNETQQLMRDKATWHHFIKAASTILSKDEGWWWWKPKSPGLFCTTWLSTVENTALFSTATTVTTNRELFRSIWMSTQISCLPPHRRWQNNGTSVSVFSCLDSELHQKEDYWCHDLSAKPRLPKVSDLPPSRLCLFKPAFYSIGVDCFVPMHGCEVIF